MDNVALYANGVQIGSTQTIASTSAKLYSLGSSLIIPAGQTVTLEIRGDVKYNGTNMATSSSLQVSLIGYTNNAQGSFAQQLTTVPASPIVGPTMTVKGAGLTLAINSAVSNYSTVANTSAQKLGSFIVQSSSAEAIRVTGLTVTLGGAAGATTNVSNLYVAVGANKTTPVSPQTSNNFSVDFTVAANSTQVINVYGDLGSVTSGVATTTLALNGYGVSSNITVAKAAVTGQTVTIGSGSLAVPTIVGGSSSIDPQFVLGGASSNIAYFNFVSTYGTSNISELYFSASGTAANITGVTVAGVSVPMVSGSATITGLNIPISVVSGGVQVPVAVTYANVGTTTGGVVSNNTVGLNLTGYKYTSGNNTVSTTTLAVASNAMTLVASKPTLALVAPSNTLLSNGTTVLGSVTVAADAAGAIELTSLPLSIATSSATTTGYTVKVNGVAVSGATVTGTGITFGSAYRINAGTSVTFEIGATVSGLVVSNGGSVSLSLGSAGSLAWNDVMGGVTAITGSAIYNYPTNSVSVSR